MNDWLAHNLLTILLALPLVGAGVVLGLRKDKHVRRVAIGMALATFATAVSLSVLFDGKKSDAQFASAMLPQFRLAIDGLSLPPVLLTTFVFTLASIASGRAVKRAKAYFALLLLAESLFLGIFLALDFVSLVVFLETSLLAMGLLIGGWGGPLRRQAVAKLWLYGLVSGLVLVMVLVGTHRAVHTFDLAASLKLTFADVKTGRSLFLLSMLAFLCRMAAAPLHSWLADAYEQTPAAVGMVLAATSLAVGGYGVFRVAFSLFPDAARHFAFPIAVLGVSGMFYGAFCAIAQREFKRLLAFAHVSQAGLFLLGAALLTPAATNGAMFVSVAFGAIAAMTLFVVAALQERTRHGVIHRLGGIATALPTCWGFSVVALFANIGLPGLCGFVGEFLVLLGGFRAARSDSILHGAGVTSRRVYALAIAACVAGVFQAVWGLRAIQRVYFGPQRPEHQGLPDLNARETTVFIPLVLIVIALGVLPWLLFFNFTQGWVTGFFKLFL